MKKIIFSFLMIVFTGFVFAPALGTFSLPSHSEVKTKPVPLPPVGDKGAASVKKILVTATAYGPPLFPEDSLTSAGEPVGWGVVAVDPRVIPLGATLSFPEMFPNKKFRAIDTGKRIKGAKVDIWLPDEQAVNEFGRKKITAVITNARYSP